jgi:transcriptional regulator with XRE-family HTH domain
MSTDYYRRLEQARVAPPSPSPQILDAIARALRLTVDERDYLYRVSDRTPPPRPAPATTSRSRCGSWSTAWATLPPRS